MARNLKQTIDRAKAERDGFMEKVGAMAPQVATALGYDGTEHSTTLSAAKSERDFWRQVDAEVAIINKMLLATQVDGMDDPRLASRMFEATINKLAPSLEAFGFPTDTGNLKRAVDMLADRLGRHRHGHHLTDARAEAVIRQIDGDEKFEEVSQLVANDKDALRLLGTDRDDLSRWARALARQWHAPPGLPATANNLELLAMNVAHVTFAMHEKVPHESDALDAIALRVWRAVGHEVPEFDRVAHRCSDFYTMQGIDEHEDAIGEFLNEWRASAYAKLEIGHKLAAALCLTDTDGVEVEAPWSACSVVVPDGLIDLGGVVQHPDGREEERSIKVARVWCHGAKPVFVVEANGKVHAMRDDDVPGTDKPARIANAMRHAIINLVRGAFIALANPEDFKKQRASKPAPAHRAQRSGPPDLAQARYLLSAPVSVDLRGELAEHLSGGRGGGGAPKVQFLVRGHWRQQAHGPRHSLRKTIWVQPFWKGPEDTRVLLRHVKVEAEQ